MLPGETEMIEEIKKYLREGWSFSCASGKAGITRYKIALLREASPKFNQLYEDYYRNGLKKYSFRGEYSIRLGRNRNGPS